MIYKLADTSKAKNLFGGWEETFVYTCMQKVMGNIYVVDRCEPTSALASVGCFRFFAGEPNRELVENKPDGFGIFVPQNKAWAEMIEEVYPEAKKVTRYAIKKDTQFDISLLKNNIRMLPEGYELRRINAALYDQCLEDSLTADFVSSFESKEKYLRDGRGFVIIKNGRIVAGASSYIRYREGIEIEVDTVESERRKHLALISCSALILKCVDEGLYPSWDAQNMDSVCLAEKLGYELDHEYVAYEIN